MDPGDEGDRQGITLGCDDWGTDWGHAGSVGGIMDIVRFTNWFVPRMICAGGILLLVMAVSQIF